jgi:hypothetical protein
MIERKYVGSNWCQSVRRVGADKAKADIEITVSLFVHRVDLQSEPQEVWNAK